MILPAVPAVSFRFRFMIRYMIRYIIRHIIRFLFPRLHFLFLKIRMRVKKQSKTKKRWFKTQIIVYTVIVRYGTDHSFTLKKQKIIKNIKKIRHFKSKHFQSINHSPLSTYVPYV